MIPSEILNKLQDPTNNFYKGISFSRYKHICITKVMAYNPQKAHKRITLEVKLQHHSQLKVALH